MLQGFYVQKKKFDDDYKTIIQFGEVEDQDEEKDIVNRIDLEQKEENEQMEEGDDQHWGGDGSSDDWDNEEEIKEKKDQNSTKFDNDVVDNNSDDILDDENGSKIEIEENLDIKPEAKRLDTTKIDNDLVDNNPIDISDDKNGSEIEIEENLDIKPQAKPLDHDNEEIANIHDKNQEDDNEEITDIKDKNEKEEQISKSEYSIEGSDADSLDQNQISEEMTESKINILPTDPNNGEEPSKAFDFEKDIQENRGKVEKPEIAKAKRQIVTDIIRQEKTIEEKVQDNQYYLSDETQHIMVLYSIGLHHFLLNCSLVFLMVFTHQRMVKDQQILYIIDVIMAYLDTGLMA